MVFKLMLLKETKAIKDSQKQTKNRFFEQKKDR